METSTVGMILGFIIQICITILSIGHYTGKYEQIIKTLQDQITMVAKDGRKTHQELQEHKENGSNLKEKVAVNEARFTESLEGFRTDIKELKDTFKEFTKEMKDWMRKK